MLVRFKFIFLRPIPLSARRPPIPVYLTRLERVGANVVVSRSIASLVLPLPPPDRTLCSFVYPILKPPPFRFGYVSNAVRGNED